MPGGWIEDGLKQGESVRAKHLSIRRRKGNYTEKESRKREASTATEIIFGEDMKSRSSESRATFDAEGLD